MAELGAEGIKVESAPRRATRAATCRCSATGAAAILCSRTPRRKACASTCGTPKARRLVNRLLERVDVMVENFSPGVIDKLGFSWDAVHALNPRLAMASVSALGQDGPLAKMPGFDFTGRSYSGVASTAGDADVHAEGRRTRGNGRTLQRLRHADDARQQPARAGLWARCPRAPRMKPKRACSEAGRMSIDSSIVARYRSPAR